MSSKVRWAIVVVVLVGLLGVALMRLGVQQGALIPPTPAIPAPLPPAPPAAAPAPDALAAAPAPRQTIEPAIVESGIAVQLIRRARVTLPEGPKRDAYSALLVEAESGNALSQYRLGLLLYECRDVPSDAAALTGEIEAVHQTRQRGGFDVDSPAAEEAALRQRYADCAGISETARTGFRGWLKQAADAGVIEAQQDLPLKLPPDDYCQFLSECPPAQRAEQEALQREAVDVLTRAREAGSVSALWTFAAWHAEGELLPKNDVEAYAHFRALDQIHAAMGETRRFEPMLAGFKRRLRPVDLDLAESRSRELLSNPNCCVITP